MAQARPEAAPADMGWSPALDAHLQAMREFHQKLQAADTPEARKTLFLEHRARMHELMTKAGPGATSMMPMVGMMGGGGMGMHGQVPGHGAGMGSGATSSMDMSSMDMGVRLQMMEQRMGMMQSMMQMMVNCNQRAPMPGGTGK